MPTFATRFNLHTSKDNSTINFTHLWPVPRYPNISHFSNWILQWESLVLKKWNVIANFCNLVSFWVIIVTIKAKINMVHENRRCKTRLYSSQSVLNWNEFVQSGRDEKQIFHKTQWKLKNCNMWYTNGTRTGWLLCKFHIYIFSFLGSVIDRNIPHRNV